MKRPYLPILLPLLLLVLSCGIDNTMYNARNYFKAAQARPLNANGRPTPQAVDEYTKAIKKCGIILTEKKDSRIADDALFLMARALYYKGNSAFQAKDQFEALIAGFPDSKHIPEAHIYLAKVLREINRAPDAEKLLEEFIRNPVYLKHHPRALLTLAEFEISDRDYHRAQYWLEKILTDYPKASEYRKAFFLFGKNYYVQKDYQASLREFEKLLSTRRIPKELKLDTRYYIALNQFHLQLYDQSYRLVQSLINDEARPDKLAQIRVLKARLFFATEQGEKGVEEVTDLGKASPRTAASAEANYHLGEYYFYQLKDMNQAITAYTKVRSEFPSSELVEPAQRRITALNQLKLPPPQKPESNLQLFLDYYTQAAQNYLDTFALPDSALLMYQRLISARQPVAAQRDTLALNLDGLHSQRDSLNLRLNELPPAEVESPEILEDAEQLDELIEETDDTGLGEIPLELLYEEEDSESAPSDSTAGGFDEEIGSLAAVEDSLAVVVEIAEGTATEEIGAELAPADSVSAPADSTIVLLDEGIDMEAAPPDSIMVPADSTMFPIPVQLTEETGGEEVPIDLSDIALEPVSIDLEEEDTILVFEENQDAPADSLDLQTEPTEPSPAQQRQELERQLGKLDTDVAALESRIVNLDGILKRFDTEIVPMAYFAKAGIYNKNLDASEEIERIHDLMAETYPDSKYTNALKAMRAGNPIRLIDPVEEAQEQRLDFALGLAATAPDSMLVILEELAASDYSSIRLKASFRLGWYYTFEAADTTQAKPYLENVLNLEQTGDYSTMTQRFFNGSEFEFPRTFVEKDTLAAADSVSTDKDLPAELEEGLAPEEPALEPDTFDIEKLPPPGPDSLDVEKLPKPEPDSLDIEKLPPPEPDSLGLETDSDTQEPEKEPEVISPEEIDTDAGAASPDPETPEKKEDSPEEPEEPNPSPSPPGTSLSDDPAPR